MLHAHKDELDAEPTRALHPMWAKAAKESHVGNATGGDGGRPAGGTYIIAWMAATVLDTPSAVWP